MKKLLSIFFICALIFSCSNDSEALKDEFDSSKKREAKANDNNAFTEFKVTITNLGGTEDYVNIFSPGVFVVQKKNSPSIYGRR